ncbi:MAG TPA: carboxypeptidase M32 [Patescibacteria group bacterium]|nr:carboxypeptidase M32 [Patescibacteria group bacterium]
MSVFTLTDPNIKKLVAISRELKDISSAIALLAWDQETYMSPKGALARAHQLETLSGIYHDKATAKSLGKLLDEVKGISEFDIALIREMQRDYTLATKLPRSLVQELSKESSLGLEAWKHAREQNNFSLFAPSLERMVKLKREVARCYGYVDSPYDALLDEFEQDLTKKKVEAVLYPLRDELKVLIPKLVTQTKQYDKGVLHQKFDGQKLWDFSMHVLEKIGFDLERGRQDKSAHPFTMGLTQSDVRLTTRILEDNPISTILSTVHEGGHGMYEQGVSPELDFTTLGYITSLVAHESQSRFWENMIGKSIEFWQYFFPQLQATFPEELEGETVESIWRELNVIKPSLIRVDADEVTYHMHIIVRFEIESALIEGRLAVHDIPTEWNKKIKEYLGVDVPSDSLGCLQDIHWGQGLIGYFPTYSLGSLFSAQIYESVLKDHPDLPHAIAKGEFEKPRKWLNEKIHTHGRLYTSDELAIRVTGKPLSSAAYLRYIEDKFAR